jgi:hypothetical protein
MQLRTWLTSAVSAVALAACSSGSTPATTPTVTKHDYNGTASAGDFITIAVDHAAQTIAWSNKTTGGNGVASYTVDVTGALLVADGSAEIKKAYEIPGYALVAEDVKARNGSKTSPLFAWQQTAASRTQFKGLSANMFQFRNTGAFEIGCGDVSASGDLFTHSGFQPENALFSVSPFVSGELLSILAAAPSPLGTFSGAVTADRADGTIAMTMYKNGVQDGSPGTLFKAGESWAADVDMGAIFFLDGAATGAFQPSHAGTYHLMGWGVAGMTSVAAGTSSFKEATITIDATGGFSILKAGGGAPETGALTPFASDADLHGAGMVGLPCNGVFTFGTISNKTLVGFVGQTLFFGSVQATRPAGVETHDYVYGVGLKVP